MAKNKIIIPKEQLRRLYFGKKLSFFSIARLLKFSVPTVVSRFRDYGFKAKKCGEWLTKYKKNDFSREEAEKAYLLGFFLGDLNAYKTSKKSSIIVVRCHTTKTDQLHLIRTILRKYGHITASKSKISGNRYSICINCYLNDSFSFLLIKKPYHIEKWITQKNKNSAAFMAGYTDAEGNFILNQRRARFKIDSYDFLILSWMHRWCRGRGIASKLRLIAKQGSMRYDKMARWRNNLWRFNINKAHALLKFCQIINPFLKHRKRIRDMKKCVSNIIIRNKNGTIKR
ncbi:MAG: hypothetical protein Q7K28_01100 [Candidatus Wildermuthbacteria bacterium]|nr:hypothetical protein [Candidatus Wildermuthbacteria bacterium]